MPVPDCQFRKVDPPVSEAMINQRQTIRFLMRGDINQTDKDDHLLRYSPGP